MIHPTTFAAERLGLHVWSRFEEFFNAIAAGERKILLRSCNGAGKTTALAAIINWMLVHFEDSVVLTSSSSKQQLKRNLWGEIRRQARHADLYPDVRITDERIELGEKHFAVGISPAVAESAQGYHAPKMLIAIDEATAIDRDIMNAMLANATGAEAQIILAYNPIDRASFPYDAERSGDWKIIQLSAFEHPNLLNDAEIISGGVSRFWIRDRLAEWSSPAEANSTGSFEFEGNWYRKTAEVAMRIFGEWSEDESEGFIQPFLLHRSKTLEVLPGSKTLGVDVARGGEDETVFAFFDGGIQLPFRTFRLRDTQQIAHEIVRAYNEGFTIVTIDDTGIGGGVTDAVRAEGVPINAIHFANAPEGFFLGEGKQLLNARSEMYFVLERELRKKDIRLLDDDLLFQELASLRLNYSANRTAYSFESKEELRKRLARSPDRADATALARYGIWIDREKQRIPVQF